MPHGQKIFYFIFAPNHMALGRWGALLDQPFQVWVYKYKNNLYCGQTNKHKLFLHSKGLCDGNSNFSP